MDNMDFMRQGSLILKLNRGLAVALLGGAMAYAGLYAPIRPWDWGSAISIITGCCLALLGICTHVIDVKNDA